MRRKLKARIKKKLSLIMSLFTSELGSNSAAGLNAANIGGIFMLAMVHSLKGMAAAITLPIAAGISTIEALLSLYQAYQADKHLHKKKLNALVLSLTALGVIATVITTFALQAINTTIAPAILTATLSLKSLYDLFSASYHWYKYAKYKNNDRKKAKEYKEEAIAITISFINSALIAAAAGTVLIAHKSSFSALGIAAGVIGSGYALYAGIKSFKKLRKQMHDSAFSNVDYDVTDIKQTNNALLHAAFGHDPIRNEILYSEPALISRIEEELNNTITPLILTESQHRIFMRTGI